MAVRPVVRFPDAVLKRAADPVTGIDDGVLALAADLLDTMRATPHCVGLAANQIGDPRRVAVVDVRGHARARSCAGEVVLVNPVVVDRTGSHLGREGCMSVPDLTGDTPRPDRVVVAYLDLGGEERHLESDAFEARALCHEVDHLDGLLFLDRVASPAAVFRRRVYR